MLIEELMPMGWPDNERPLAFAHRDEEIARRNAANSEAWFVKVYGPIVGPQLFAGNVAVFQRGYRVEYWRSLTRKTIFERIVAVAGEGTMKVGDIISRDVDIPFRRS